MTPEEIDLYLASPAGQNLGAGDWNRLRQAGVNAYNYRANDLAQGIAPAGPPDKVFTGHATESLPFDSTVAGLVPQVTRQYLSGGPQGTMRMGDQLYAGGQRLPYGYGQMASAAQNDGFTPEQAMAGLSYRAPVSMADRIAQLSAARDTDPRLRNLSGLQFNNLFTQAVGTDPLSYADRLDKRTQESHKTAQDNLRLAIEMQKSEAERRKALLDEYGTLGKFAGGLPEDILASVGKNPAGAGHENEYFNPGRMLPPDGMGEERQVPGGWRGIDTGTVGRLRQIRETLGMTTQPQFDAAGAQAQMDADMAEKAALRARAGQAPPSAQQYGPPAPAGIRARQFIGSGIPAAAAAVNGRLGNFNRGAANLPIHALNFLSQMATGNATHDIAPFAPTYDSRNPPPATWADVPQAVARMYGLDLSAQARDLFH